MQNTSLASNPQMEKALKDRLASLALPLLEKGTEMPNLDEINGKTFPVESNEENK